MHFFFKFCSHLGYDYERYCLKVHHDVRYLESLNLEDVSMTLILGLCIKM